MEGLKLKSAVASFPIKLSPHQRPMTDVGIRAGLVPRVGLDVHPKACKGLFPYTSCIPILLQVSCVSTLFGFWSQFFVNFFQFVDLLVTAGSDTRFIYLLPPFWPIGALHSLHSLVLEPSLLCHSLFTEHYTIFMT
jgi:hypothetical protein